MFVIYYSCRVREARHECKKGDHMRKLAENDLLTLNEDEDEGERLVMVPKYTLSLLLAENEFEYPPIDELLDGMDNGRGEWTYARAHGALIIWDERRPAKSWIWADQGGSDIREFWERGQYTTLARR